VLVECHPSARIEFGVLFSKAGARIEENVYVGPRCCLGLVHLERDVLIAPGVQIPRGNRIHDIAEIDRPIREQRPGTHTTNMSSGSCGNRDASTRACLRGALATV
jgi:hypothetical protein